MTPITGASSAATTRRIPIPSAGATTTSVPSPITTTTPGAMFLHRVIRARSIMGSPERTGVIRVSRYSVIRMVASTRRPSVSIPVIGVADAITERHHDASSQGRYAVRGTGNLDGHLRDPGAGIQDR